MSLYVIALLVDFAFKDIAPNTSTAINTTDSLSPISSVGSSGTFLLLGGYDSDQSLETTLSFDLIDLEEGTFEDSEDQWEEAQEFSECEGKEACIEALRRIRDWKRAWKVHLW